MSDDRRVNYFGVTVKASRYKVIQLAAIGLAVIGAVFSYVFLRGYEHWLVRNAWWIFICIAVIETVETLVALSRARKPDGLKTKREST